MRRRQREVWTDERHRAQTRVPDGPLHEHDVHRGVLGRVLSIQDLELGRGNVGRAPGGRRAHETDKKSELNSHAAHLRIPSSMPRLALRSHGEVLVRRQLAVRRETPFVWGVTASAESCGDGDVTSEGPHCSLEPDEADG